MAVLDAPLVRRWFGVLSDRTVPLMPHWGITPSAAEHEVLAEGRELVLRAIADSTIPGPPHRPAPEPAARQLQTYLHALAAGVGGTQATLRGSAPDPLTADRPAVHWSDRTRSEDAGGAPRRPRNGAGRESHGRRPAVRPSTVGSGTASDTRGTPAARPVEHDAAGAPEDDGSAPSMALVAGLIAGAAALQDSLGGWSPPETPKAEPTAAEVARLAGVTAAELAVDGADLAAIAAQAAGTAVLGWTVGVPGDARALTEYRTRGLIGMLLIALQQASRAPEPPAEPASCGAGPGEHRGSAFDAEIGFEIRCEDPERDTLIAELQPLAQEVRVWSSNGVHAFHVHTRRPGEVISLAYASGMLFDLEITALPGS
ncbi:hypothetical protein [Nakamurella leprariae]|uniref:Fatty acid kinase subunit A-like middle domain-containing protein n=1 Tax=Nakamurella leprariae TaxID=2803911 RepID=A0A938YH80_9ACTN|nr:hypothetical protein [Nakamurella leprariae]MBM9469558.1 hypothetical protein [Nakamurella leprariae]